MPDKIVKAIGSWFRRLIPWTLRGQIALALALITAAAMVGLGIYLERTTTQTYIDDVAAGLEAEAKLIGRSLAPLLLGGAAAEEIDAQVKAFAQDTSARITLVNVDGIVVGDSIANPAEMDNHLDRPEIVDAIETGYGTTQRQSGTVDREYFYVAVRIDDAPEYVLETAIPMTDIDEANAALRRRIVGAALIATLAASAAGFFFAHRTSTSLAQLQDSVTRVASGELGAEIEIPRTEELGTLANAFNLMTLRLDESFAETRRARMRWASAFASLSDGLILVDSQETISAINPAGARLLETDLEWAVGKKFVLVARDHELISLLRESLRRQEARRSFIEFTRGGLIVEASAIPVAGFNEPHAVVTLRDVTELRRLESVRREFVANVSHELRTPIASIKAMVETLEAGALEDHELTLDFLERMVGESDRLAALVDELLDLGRLESGRIQLHLDSLDPRDLLTRAAERLRPQTERAGIALSLDVPAGLPDVLADRSRIEQVVLNLVHNAIKFTPPGGSIVVRAEPADSELKVEVIDTGSGISEEDIGRLFERFYKVDRSRRSEGTGLGLAIAKHIIQLHDGSIGVESELGRGSRFVFTLPFSGNATQD